MRGYETNPRPQGHSTSGLISSLWITELQLCYRARMNVASSPGGPVCYSLPFSFPVRGLENSKITNTIHSPQFKQSETKL